MEPNSITGLGESETKAEKPSGTARGGKSRKSAKTPTSPETLLRILSQAAFDIDNSHECHEREIGVRFVALDGEVIIRVRGSQLSHEQTIVPRTQEAKQSD